MAIVQEILKYFQHLNFQDPNWDALLVIFFAVSTLFYGISLGKDRLLIILMSIYMSLAVVNSIPPKVFSMELQKVFAFQVTAFLAIFLVLFFVLSQFALLRALGGHAAQGSLWQSALLSILHTGLLTSVAFTFLPAEILHNFSPQIQTTFTHEWARFGWTAAPIAAMLLMKGGQKPPLV